MSERVHDGPTASGARSWQAILLWLASGMAVADSPVLDVGALSLDTDESATQDGVDTLPPIVFADGSGLPDGSGNALRGASVYAERCAACHGGRGEGGTAVELIGDQASLSSEWPDRGIGAFWPYGPPLFDYVRRSMPPDAPGSLSVDDTYAVLAHLLVLNGLHEPAADLDRQRLSTLQLPNRHGFIDPAGLRVEPTR